MNENEIVSFLTENKDLPTSDLALLAGKSVTTIRRWKRKYGFSKSQSPFMAQYVCPKILNPTEHDISNWDTKEWLEQKYVVEGLGVTAIGRLVGKAAWSISVRLKRHGIEIDPTRNRSKNPFCSEKWLAYHYGSRRDYVDWCASSNTRPDEDGGLALSLGKCAEIAGVSPYTIYNWLSKFGMYIRSKEEARAASLNPRYDFYEHEEGHR